MNIVEKLSNRLRTALMDSLNPNGWEKSHLMSKELAKNEKSFGQLSSGFSEDFTNIVLNNFRRTGSLNTYREWKHACYGVSQLADLRGWRLIEDDSCFKKLLTHLEGLKAEPKRFLKCFLGLLAGYFKYPILSDDLSVKGKANWEHLRTYLNDCLPGVLSANQQASHKLLQTLSEHQNLLQVNPCARYSADLLHGDTQELDQIMRVLGITTDSWVREEAVLAQFDKACQFNDKDFQSHLDNLLGIIQGGKGFSLSVELSRRCTAILVCRYAECSSWPEHALLRDIAVKQIGNPWLKRAAWDAYVKTIDGNPHEDARQMVNGWLKRRLIRDFFELLSDDGSADTRRLSYWLRFEDAIDDMWFALGPYAQSHRAKEFVDFRTRADGRRLALEGGTSRENNAFIMRLGEWVIVEFGATGNACYLYRWSGLPFDLNKPSLRGDKSGLKSPRNDRRGIHIDSSQYTWENKFDEWLCPLINFYPERKRSQYTKKALPPERPLNEQKSLYGQQSSSTPGTNKSVYENRSQPVVSLSKAKTSRQNKEDSLGETFNVFVRRYSLKIEDNRTKGGAMWVRHDNSKPYLNVPLLNWGFKYKPDKGWWLE